MSDAHIDIRGATSFKNDLCNADVHSTGLGSSECHDELKAPLSMGFSDDWARMSSNTVDSTSKANAQDLPLRSSSDDREGLLRPSASGRYTYESLTDPLGRLHQNIKYRDPLDACHSRKGEYPKRDLQAHVPRYMPELPKGLTNPYFLPTGTEIGPEISKAVPNVHLQSREAPSDYETATLHGENASTKVPVSGLEQNHHAPKEEGSTIQKVENLILLSSAVTAIVVIQRCIKHRSPARGNPSLQATVVAQQESIQDHCHDLSYPRDSGLSPLLSVHEPASDSSDTNSVDSFEDDFTDSNRADQNSDQEDSFLRLHVGRSKDDFGAFQSTLDRYPDDVVSYLADQISSLFDVWLRRLAVLQHTGRPNSSSSSSISQKLTKKSSDATFLAGNGRQQSNDEDEDDPSPPGDGSNGDKKRSRGSSEVSKKRWACPFYRKNPRFYCMEREFGDYRSCSKRHGFSEVHRVKTHLILFHTAIYCFRCYRQFKSDRDLKTHMQSATICDARAPQPLEGLDKEQRSTLKPRDRTKSQEERWKTIYRICFPGDRRIPSPYYISPETPLYREEVLAIVRDTLSIDNAERDEFLQRLEDNLTASDRRFTPSPSPRPPLVSASGASHPSDWNSDDAPQWRPLPISHQTPAAVQNDQGNRFIADDTSTDAMGVEDGISYSTTNSYFMPAMKYDSGYTDGSIG